jgi:hypothetical protein
MKRRAKKTKSAAKPRTAKKGAAKPKQSAGKAAAPATKPTPYTPAPIKSDGWPPFRYPLQ